MEPVFVVSFEPCDFDLWVGFFNDLIYRLYYLVLSDFELVSQVLWAIQIPPGEGVEQVDVEDVPTQDQVGGFVLPDVLKQQLDTGAVMKRAMNI